MAEKENNRADKWEKMESFAKILAGFSAAASAIVIPILINSYTEKNRKAEMLVKTMTEREKSDTDIRQSMFQTLLTGYLGAIKDDLVKGDEDSFRRRIMFLELLAINFQEFFNARPLFEEVYKGLERKRNGAATDAEIKQWENLEKEIIRVSTDIISRQANMLNNIGNEGGARFNLDKGNQICVRLYNRDDFANLRQEDGATRFQSFQPGRCVEQRNNSAAAVPKGDTRRQSLEIMLIEVNRSTAKVRVGIYEDVFDKNVFRGSVPKTTIPFEVSVFDLPYTDNTKMSDGSRFALMLRRIDGDSVEFEALRFRDDFMSVRDRPLFQEMLRKLE